MTEYLRTWGPWSVTLTVLSVSFWDIFRACAKTGKTETCCRRVVVKGLDSWRRMGPKVGRRR